MSGVNETTFQQSLVFSDHESYYHDMWQSVAYNRSHWLQTIYFNGVNVFRMAWDST